MKCLVISNCATASYVDLLQHLKPDWTIKGVTSDIVRDWLDSNKNPAFLDYARATDVYVGFDLPPSYDALPLCTDADKVIIPPFVFRGLHPDCINLRTAGKSVLENGEFHSRIAVIGWMLGATVDQTVACFNGAVYRALGYFSTYPAARKQFINGFRTFGIDLSDQFPSWEAAGKFVYTINHPTKRVLFDVLRQALIGRFLTAAESAASALLLDQVEDQLAKLIIWPVYPEIGAEHGIVEPFLWRTSESRGSRTFDLKAFVAATFARLQTARDIKPDDITEYSRYAAVLADRLGGDIVEMTGAPGHVPAAMLRSESAVTAV